MSDSALSGERSRGLYKLLSFAPVYNLFRRGVGVGRVRDTLVSEYMVETSGCDVLDVGCGTAEMSQWLSNCDYSGFDPNPSYVASARSAYGESINVWQASIDDPMIEENRRYQIVLGYGVLHHVDDETAFSFFELAARYLTPDGRVFTIDPCLYDGQPALARRVVSADRGPWVRRPEDYRELANPWFSSVTCNIRENLLRIPYTHLIMEASGIASRE